MKLIGIAFGIGLLCTLAMYLRVEVLGQTKPVQHHPAPLAGKVQTRDRDKLERFREPIRTAPRIHPLPIEGRRWHWHSSYGWVALPVGAFQEVVLPANYALPAQVQVYETATPAACQMSCPHCGQPLTVSLK